MIQKNEQAFKNNLNTHYIKNEESLSYKKLLKEKTIFNFNDEKILLFDFIQTKNFKATNGKSHNGLILFILESGLLIINTINGEELHRIQTNITDPVEISSPQNPDDSLFCVLSRDGSLFIVNFRIIDSSFTHNQYLKELGVKKIVGNKT